jgi:hypothetical protein
MIGGDDVIVFPIRDCPALRAFVDRYFHDIWPRCVVRERQRDCVFYYRDTEVQRTSIFGITSDNDDAVVQAIYGGNELTLVVSAVAGARTRRMADELSQNIRANTWDGR